MKMPELPEVETTRRLLEPYIKNKTIKKIIFNRKNLRFELPNIMVSSFENVTITILVRHGKYMMWHCDNGYSIIVHLGMTGRFLIADHNVAFPDFYHDHKVNPIHEHCVFYFQCGLRISYYDPRRFGFFDCIKTSDLYQNKFLKILGIDGLNLIGKEDILFSNLKNKKSPIKNLLLNQSIIAGVGNIYASEALWRAKIHPQTSGNMLNKSHITLLTHHIHDILSEAIIGGGSTLKDYRSPVGDTGNYQNLFKVYDRIDKKCPDEKCLGIIEKIIQSNRASFFCNRCQV
jgi:formamidopyrimidine-DNA glycosylase